VWVGEEAVVGYTISRWSAPDVERGAIVEAVHTRECVHQLLQRHRRLVRTQAEAAEVGAVGHLDLQLAGRAIGHDGSHGVGGVEEGERSYKSVLGVPPGSTSSE
jgi:hypothetical protein